MQENILNRLAIERSNPCVTISMNTHRTHPENAVDANELKNLITLAKHRIINKFGKRNVNGLLEQIDNLNNEINYNQNLESLHIFISNSTRKIIRSILTTHKNTVHVSNSFAVKPLIRVLNQTEEYYILLLSQSGAKLLYAINDTISQEITNNDFPFSQNPYYLTDNEKLSDGKQVDNLVYKYFGEVDTALQKIYNNTGLNCIVICTEDNYSKLNQVADIPAIYYGYSNMDYNDVTDQNIAAQAWSVIKNIQHKFIEEAVNEMQEALQQGKALTNISDIFHAVKEGRGDLLIISNNYHQAAKMTGKFSFELIEDIERSEITEDIISGIAWDVITKNGRAIFVDQEDIKSLGNISLKIRY